MRLHLRRLQNNSETLESPRGPVYAPKVGVTTYVSFKNRQPDDENHDLRFKRKVVSVGTPQVFQNEFIYVSFQPDQHTELRVQVTFDREVLHDSPRNKDEVYVPRIRDNGTLEFDVDDGPLTGRDKNKIEFEAKVKYLIEDKRVQEVFLEKIELLKE